ncbi:MAG: O-antigen ligase family protein [Bacteroidia bacterium]|nr:O-antigen ligase family protein [Bacteroidia bacterium]
MLDRFLSNIPIKVWRMIAMAAFALIVVGAIGMALKMKMWPLYAVPIAAVVALQVLYDYKPLFFLLIAAVPISIQLEIGPLALDVPSEPLMILFLVIFLVELIAGNQFKQREKVRPFHLLIFLLLFWTAFTTVTSEFPLRSVKFLLAKLWYLAAFVWMAQRLILSQEDIKKIFWFFFIPLVIAATIVTVRHALLGFSFEASNNVPIPLFINAVIYSATLVLFLPWTWFARKWYSAKTLEWYLIHAGMGLLLLAAFFTYKRGAWLALLLLPFIDQAIKRKFFDKAVYVGVIVLSIALAWLVYDNRFYVFAPNYQKVIWHEGDLSGHLEATISGTEISSMERFYRWVAAKNMIADMPLAGSGPSTFNQVYKRYTDDAFRTYVSDNPEQSTTHNYFLLTFSEQGFIGGLLFLFLCLFMIVKAARLYPELSDERKTLLMMVLLSQMTILFHSLLNELIEVDKVGAMFWVNWVIMDKLAKWHEQESGLEESVAK